MLPLRLRAVKSRGEWVVIVAVTGVTIFVLWELAAYPRGAVMAYIDHACGRYELKTYGFPIWVWDEPYCRLLEERYGVHMDPIADCTVSPNIEWYADGYNTVSKRLFFKRHGKDVFMECHDFAHNTEK